MFDVAPQSRIFLPRPGQFENPESVFAIGFPRGNAGDGGRRRAAMLAVMAMDVNRPIGLARRPGDRGRGPLGQPVVTDGDVHVPQSVPAGRFDVGACAVDADDRPDPQLCQAGKSLLTLGFAPREEAVTHLDDVVEPGEIAGQALRFRAGVPRSGRHGGGY